MGAKQAGRSCCQKKVFMTRIVLVFFTALATVGFDAKPQSLILIL